LYKLLRREVLVMTAAIEDKDLLIKILLDERRSRDFQAALMWENVKFFSTLISALITADILLLRLFLDLKMRSSIPLLLLYLMLPGFIMSMSYMGERDLKRRWKRILEAIANCSKIESLLGVDTEISGKLRVFQKDRYLFPERWFKSRSKYSTTEDFIEGELKPENMYTQMRKIYFITSLVGLLLVVLHVVLLAH